MFGDFSRFENNPELGVTGVYLSQGSPILDSDWNEQTAALSNWITLVGRMAAGDTARFFGFEASAANGVLSVQSGIAMVAGRICESCHEIKAAWDKSKFSDPLVMVLDKAQSVPYLVVVERASQSPPVIDTLGDSPLSIRMQTRWRICFASEADKLPKETRIGSPDPKDFRELRARSFGETQHLTPTLKVSWKELDVRLRTKLAGSNLAMIECHSSDTQDHLFKIASSPRNGLRVNTAGLSENNPVIAFRPGQCTVLDNLAGVGKTDVLVEIEDEQSDFRLAVDLFKGEKKNTRQIYPATVDSTLRTVTISGPFPVQRDREVDLRIWNLKTPSSDLSFALNHDEQPETREKGVRCDIVSNTELLPGDRWYLPLQSGHPVEVMNAKIVHLRGHRIFRAIARLDASVKVVNGELTVSETWPAAAQLVMAEGVLRTLDKPILQTVAVEEPARRFDASFHRLTSALEAARELTRKTACKDLPIRVSYLPLRRWLASVSVHEIADLDLNGFLARIRRSLEVPPEEEHLLTEQASLVLEEASRLAGPLPVETIGSRFA